MKFRYLFYLLCFLLLPVFLPAAEFYLDVYDYYLNLPATWSVYSAETEDYLVFQDQHEKAFFQVQTLHRTTGDTSPAAVCRETLAGLQPRIETAVFSYNGNRACYGTVGFSMGEATAEGFTVCIELEDTFVLLFAYTAEQNLTSYMPLLLSCLDGFSYTRGGRKLPGPVSQFYYPFPGEQEKQFRIRFQSGEIPVFVDPGEVDASQDMIEREARILAELPELNIDAWERYYQLIYRDSYMRIEPAARKIGRMLTEKDDYTKASELLTWLQGFSYLRTGTVSDLQSPLQTLLTATGDCDSLGLLYCIILDYLGIESILLVSNEYAHSIVGVDVPGEGARFQYEETSYLVAELTDQVEIGLIDRTMADPGKWIPISLQSGN